MGYCQNAENLAWSERIANLGILKEPAVIVHESANQKGNQVQDRENKQTESSKLSSFSFQKGRIETRDESRVK